MGYKSTSTVQMYLDRLAEYGYIRRADGKSRSILLCDPFSYQKIRCLRAGAVLSQAPSEDDLCGELPFAYANELPSGTDLIACPVKDAWWIVAVGGDLPLGKPRVFVKNGEVTLSDPDSGEESVGVLLGKIFL